MNRKDHWERVFSTKNSTEVSWFQAEPSTSLEMLDTTGVTAESWIIDIGGGDSRLVDALLDRGSRCIAVLDVSAAALRRARLRAGRRAQAVQWIEADVTGEWPVPQVDVWHDRAVFHFLTSVDDRRRYMRRLRQAVKIGGHVIFATFALDGPVSCSGLPVVRYSSERLASEAGADFSVVDSRAERHETPFGTVQPFCWTVFKRLRHSVDAV